MHTESSNNADEPVNVKLVCGADVLQSFAVPGVWKPEHVIYTALSDFDTIETTAAAL